MGTQQIWVKYLVLYRRVPPPQSAQIWLVCNKGITVFTWHPNTNHTCLYSPAARHHRPLAGSNLYSLVTEAHRCEKLAQKPRDQKANVSQPKTTSSSSICNSMCGLAWLSVGSENSVFNIRCSEQIGPSIGRYGSHRHSHYQQLSLVHGSSNPPRVCYFLRVAYNTVILPLPMVCKTTQSPI